MKPIYEARVPLFNKGWQDEREVVGIGVACDEVWRYKQQNRLNWFDHILTEERWQGQEEAFGRHSDNLGDVGAQFIRYQGTDHDWPDFLFGGDGYPGYPDNPILTLSEVDYQQRIWDVFAANDDLRTLHGNVPSAFKGGDHEFANATPLQPGGRQGRSYLSHIRNAYEAVSLDGYEPVREGEMSYISRPIPGWIEVFHEVIRGCRAEARGGILRIDRSQRPVNPSRKIRTKKPHPEGWGNFTPETLCDKSRRTLQNWAQNQ